MKKKRIAFHGSGYRKSYLLTHPHVLIKHWCNEVKYFIQRGLYGYADEDWWSLDWYLSTWMPSAIREIGHMSYPGYGEADTSKKWKKILEEIAQGFEASYKLKDGFPTEKETKKLLEKEEKGLELFKKWFGHLWD